MTTHDLYVDGAWIPTLETTANVSPSDQTDIVGYFAAAEEEHLNDAVAAAAHSFTSWRLTSPQYRADLLQRVAQGILKEQHDLARQLAREEGKTFVEAHGEVVRAAQIFHFFSGEALRLTGERQASTRPGVSITLQREPIGVIGIITPWNFPIAIPAWKIAPALAYGNTIVFKPAQLVPASAHSLARIIDDAGFPRGVFNMITGSGSKIGPLLSRHPGVNAVTFTGSEEVGRGVASAASARLVPVQLEMGGKNPLVVLADADLPAAVECAVQGAFFSTGQRCTASSRLIIEEQIHDQFVELLLNRMSELTIGHSLDENTDIGPVVDAAQLATDMKALEAARALSGLTVIGGEQVAKDTNGYFLSPAIFLGSDNSEAVTREEIFGPIASVIRASDYDHALAIANDTPFGLVGGICTTSLARAEHFQASSDTGMVMVNLPTAGVDPHVSFGGRKRSSYGPHEQGTHARDFFTQSKTVYVKP